MARPARARGFRTFGDYVSGVAARSTLDAASRPPPTKGMSPVGENDRIRRRSLRHGGEQEFKSVLWRGPAAAAKAHGRRRSQDQSSSRRMPQQGTCGRDMRRTSPINATTVRRADHEEGTPADKELGQEQGVCATRSWRANQLVQAEEEGLVKRQANQRECPEGDLRSGQSFKS